MSSSGLSGLPEELLRDIAACLAEEDSQELRKSWCSFRTSCKRIDESTRHIFRCALFRKQQTNLSARSLERMTTIAKKPHLALYVHTLVVKFVAEPQDRLGEDLTWKRHASGYLLPEAGVLQWTKVLGYLKNCTAFHLIREGWSDKDSCLSNFTSTDIITVILNGIIEARIPVHEFFVDFIPPQLGGANELDVRRVNVLDLEKPEFAAAWANLQALLLNFTMNQPPSTMNQPPITDWIDPIVRHATNLRKLTIAFDNGSAAQAIIERLKSMINPLQLQELTLTHMAKSKLNEALLMDLLSPHRDRLRLLCIRGVTLDDAGWKSIFGELVKFPSLAEFSFGNLKENRSFVHFPSASDSLVTDKHTTFTFHRLKSLGINTDVSCRGPGARTTLQTLFESMQVGNPMGLKQTAYSA